MSGEPKKQSDGGLTTLRANRQNRTNTSSTTSDRSNVVSAPHPLESTRFSNIFHINDRDGLTVNLSPSTVLSRTSRGHMARRTVDLGTITEASTDEASGDEVLLDFRSRATPRRESRGGPALLGPPSRWNQDSKSYTVAHERNIASVQSILSEVTIDDEEVPTILNVPISKNDDSDKPNAAKEARYPNSPHQALEFPPLYYMLRNFPKLLEYCESLYHFRWSMFYPFQRRILFSKTLGKIGIFFTWGELFLVLPFFAFIITGTITSFINPSVSISGHMSRTPLIFCFITAMRNSFLTLLFGIPVERAIWYHKLSARVAYFNGILHTYVAFVHPDREDGIFPPTSQDGTNPNFWRFLFADQINSGGTLLIVFMTLIMVTVIPWIRHRLFEMFYYCHLVFAASLIICAFFHTGIVVPILAALTWGVDLFIRKIQMASFRNPKNASIFIISDSVVKVTFRKSDGFDYNPGQYVYLAVPELSLFEWHPFSLSSSPGQKSVSLHIRKAGKWTSALYDLAEQKTEIRVLMEGPYGSVGVDLLGDRYKMVMLISGGIGVTPMQALCNQLMYEHSSKKREMKKLTFIWVERDPTLTNAVDVVRHTGAKKTKLSRQFSDPSLLVKPMRNKSIRSMAYELDDSQSIASTLLSMVPASYVTDEQLEKIYPKDVDLDDVDDNSSIVSGLSYLTRIMSVKRVKPISRTPAISQKESKRSESEEISFADIDHATMKSSRNLFDDEETVVREAYQQRGFANEDAKRLDAVLDLQVYVTGKGVSNNLAHLPFVNFTRPDLKKLFADMREDAMAKGETHVAVCVCAPARLVHICRKACVKYSDWMVHFDFHEEVFG